jgi:hypothetical protein
MYKVRCRLQSLGCSYSSKEFRLPGKSAIAFEVLDELFQYVLEKSVTVLDWKMCSLDERELQDFIPFDPHTGTTPQKRRPDKTKTVSDNENGLCLALNARIFPKTLLRRNDFTSALSNIIIVTIYISVKDRS